MSAALSLLKSFGRDSKPYKGFGKLRMETMRLKDSDWFQTKCTNQLVKNHTKQFYWWN